MNVDVDRALKLLTGSKCSKRGGKQPKMIRALDVPVSQTLKKMVCWFAKNVWVFGLLMSWKESKKKVFVRIILDHSHKGSFILHQHNAPADSYLSEKAFWAKHTTHVLDNPPYFPDIVPYDFYLFQIVKSDLKRTTFRAENLSKQNQQWPSISWQKRISCTVLHSRKLCRCRAGMAKGCILNAIKLQM